MCETSGMAITRGFTGDCITRISKPPQLPRSPGCHGFCVPTSAAHRLSRLWQTEKRPRAGGKRPRQPASRRSSWTRQDVMRNGLAWDW